MPVFVRNLFLVGIVLFTSKMATALAGDQTLHDSVYKIGSSDIPKERSILRVHLENDFFGGVDGDYTNGFRADYISQPYSGVEKSHDHLCGNRTSSYLATGLGALVGGTGASSRWSKICGMDRTSALREHWAFSLTQFMFTPETKSSFPIYGERGYAGYLGFGVGTLVKNEDRANSFELQIGVTGDPSLTRNTQHFIHKRLGMIQWPGWQNQLPSEATFCFFFKRYYRLRCLEHQNQAGKFETDGFAFWHTDLGTLYLRGGVGMSYRFGYNLPNTSQELSIAGASFPASPFARNKKSISNWSYYGFAGMSGRFVGRDMFLDGTAFHSSPRYVHKFPFVADVSGGIGVKYKNVELLFGYTVRSKEYHTQHAAQTLGSIQLRVMF